MEDLNDFWKVIIVIGVFIMAIGALIMVTSAIICLLAVGIVYGSVVSFVNYFLALKSNIAVERSQE